VRVLRNCAPSVAIIAVISLMPEDNSLQAGIVQMHLQLCSQVNHHGASLEPDLLLETLILGSVFA